MSKIIDALNNIDEDYLDEAINYQKKPKKSFNLAIVFASLFLLVSVPIIVPMLKDEPHMVTVAKPIIAKYENQLYLFDGEYKNKLPKGYEVVGNLNGTAGINELENNMTNEELTGTIYFSNDHLDLYIETTIQEKEAYYHFVLIPEN